MAKHHIHNVTVVFSVLLKLTAFIIIQSFTAEIIIIIVFLSFNSIFN